MNNNQFSAVVEVDNIFNELQKDICRVFNKYGVKDELINEILKNTQRLEMFVSSEQNKCPNDSTDGSFNTRRLESQRQHEKRLTNNLCK